MSVNKLVLVEAVLIEENLRHSREIASTSGSSAHKRILEVF